MIYDGKWFKLWKDKSFALKYDVCGYFDCRPRIVISMFFLHAEFILPIYNPKWNDECLPPSYGIAIHNNNFWIYYGGKGNFNGGNKSKGWSFPFVEQEWIRTSILLKDDSWEHETKCGRKQFWKDDWKNKQKSWTYNYVDSYDGEIIPTTIYVEEREWRPKWLTWTKLFAKTKRSIDVHFSKEVGEKKGSWKGGCLGCGYEMLKNESPLDCFKRMEKERVF